MTSMGQGPVRMRKLSMHALLAIITSFVITGCASGYKEFYTPSSGATPEEISANRASTPPATPLVERSAFGDADQIVDRYAKRGYVIIGESHFNSGERVSEEDALEQGKAVGADLVLVYLPKYTGSITSSMPITTPTTSTSFTSGSANAYGPGGPVTAYGNATTTTYGSTTTYVPITVNRSDYGAIYFVKGRFRLGVFVRNLNDLEKQLLQTNQGVVVRTIVDDSPAYKADVLVGDMLVAIDGEKVSNEEGFTKMIAARRGQAVRLALIRNGTPLLKTVQVGK
ncbi:PDZ domain-containing protein [Pseudomonas syringae]|nr:PDZ domain-containing protein [Pseudomonas syringae]QVI70607.1 PDZ domain-containing protein [Pseudomonas syringae]QWB05248.1 PDZ domain-containing protein [Pseudomonas syringae]